MTGYTGYIEKIAWLYELHATFLDNTMSESYFPKSPVSNLNPATPKTIAKTLSKIVLDLRYMRLAEAFEKSIAYPRKITELTQPTTRITENSSIGLAVAGIPIE